MSSVVVGIPVPNEAVVRHLVPFFTGDFAGFAAYAYGRISEKTIPQHFPAHNCAGADSVLWVPSPIILSCPLCRDCAKTFHRLVHRAAVVQDVNLVAGRIAARIVRAKRENLGRVANDQGLCCKEAPCSP